MDSPEEMQKKDPLGIQMWSLYSKTKSQLPNQERMENLSWRMMSMNLMRQQEQHRVRYIPLPCDFFHSIRSLFDLVVLPFRR